MAVPTALDHHQIMTGGLRVHTLLGTLDHTAIWVARSTVNGDEWWLAVAFTTQLKTINTPCQRPGGLQVQFLLGTLAHIAIWVARSIVNAGRWRLAMPFTTQ